MELFDIAGEEFYFDLDSIADFVRISEDDTRGLDEIFTKKSEEDDLNEGYEIIKEELIQGPLIDMTRWDLTKAMIETILSENGVVDEHMGIAKLGEQLSIPFRLSFNTLAKYKLIKIR